MPTGLTRALRARGHEVWTVSLHGAKWSGLGVQVLAFSLVLALLLCDFNGVI